MDYFMSSPHDPLKRRRWEETTTFYPRFLGGSGSSGAATTTTTAVAPQPSTTRHHQLLPPPSLTSPCSPPRKLFCFSALDNEMACAVAPPVTVVLEGRSICHRIHLHKHDSYESLAVALRSLFVDIDGGDCGGASGGAVQLSNAVPGHMVAYEDMEDDLLLAGDLSWRDFVRVAKRIRILPEKPSRRKNTATTTTITSAGGAEET